MNTPTTTKFAAQSDLLAGFDHLHPRLGRDGTPVAYYEALRDEAQARDRFVARSEMHDGFWAVLGYEEYSEVTRNPAAFSNTEPTFPRYGTGEALMIAGQDDPDHRFARALVNSPFGPNGVRIYDDILRDNVNLLIRRLHRQGRGRCRATGGATDPSHPDRLADGLAGGTGSEIYALVSCTF